MKKKHIALFCLSAAFALCAFGACTNSDNSSTDKNGYYNNEQVIVGGGSNANEAEETPVIVGATDIYLTSAATAATLKAETDKVYVQKGDETLAVTVDTSLVTLGTPNQYKITYTYGALKEERTVYIYAAPTVTDEKGGAVTLTYSQAYVSLAEGLSFKDSFNTALEAQVVSDGGMENADGSLNLGVFTVKYMAVDKAGQTVYATRQVTVTEEKTPNVSDCGYDMADESLIITPDTEDYDAFLALSLDGAAIPAEYIKKSAGSIYVSGDYIYSVAGRSGEKPLRYLSAKGYKDVTLTLSDEKEVAVDETDLLAFERGYYACFGAYEIPEMARTNKRQSETPIVKVFKSGEEVALADGKFKPETDGNYTLQVTVREKAYEYTLVTYYDLGFEQGMAFGQDTDINGYFNDDYELVEYRVRSLDKTQTLALYKAGSENFGDMAAFQTAVKALNKSESYLLYVTAKNSSGEALVQQARFIVLGADALSIAAVADDITAANMNVYPNKSDSTYITAWSEEIGGRRGVYKWGAVKDVSTDNAILRFNQKFLGEERTLLKKDTYVTFEMYVDSEERILPAFSVDGSYLYLYQDVATGRDVANFNIYNVAGERFTGGSFMNKTFNKQWVTVEVKLHKDMSTTIYNGLSVWSDDYGPKLMQDVYIANIRASATSLMGDTTVNGKITADDEAMDVEVTVPDIWKDLPSLY